MRELRIKRGDVWWVGLDPTQGSEIKKTRPCVILTADELNRLRKTIVVVPLSTSASAYPPITVPATCQGKAVVAIVDQIRAVAKQRLKSRIEKMDQDEFATICRAVSSILQLSRE